MCGGEPSWALGCAVIQETTLRSPTPQSLCGALGHIPGTSPNGDSSICLTEELLIVCKVLKSNSLKELNSSPISTSKKHNTNAGVWW